MPAYIAGLLCKFGGGGQFAETEWSELQQLAVGKIYYHSAIRSRRRPFGQVCCQSWSSEEDASLANEKLSRLSARVDASARGSASRELDGRAKEFY